MTTTPEEQTNRNCTCKKYLGVAVLGSAITLVGILGYNSLHDPQRIKISEVEKKAEEIYDTLKGSGFLKYNLDGKDVTLTLSSWSGGRYGGFIGHSINLDNGGGIIFESDRIRTSRRGADARTLRAVEISVSDGRRQFKIKDAPKKEELQSKYDLLIEQIYQEKIKHDLEAKGLLNRLK